MADRGGLFPLLLILGLPISLSAPLANLFAVPWISLLVLPLALAGTLLLAVPWLGSGLLWLAGRAGLAVQGPGLAGRARTSLDAGRGACGLLVAQSAGRGAVIDAQGHSLSPGLAPVAAGGVPAS